MKKGAHTAGAGFCLLLGVGDIVVLNQFLVPGYVQQGAIHEPLAVQANTPKPAQQPAAPQPSEPAQRVAPTEASKPPVADAANPAEALAALAVEVAEPVKAEAPEPVEAVEPRKQEQAQLQPPEKAERVRPQAWTINFGHNSDRLNAQARAALARVAKAAGPGSRVRVEGHTDSVGVSIYNVDLSRRRARQVMSWLSRHGVKRTAIDLGWHGEEQPRMIDNERGARALNRRVEVSVVR